VFLGDSFFLVGGTALALHIGHRKSVDLDFFCKDPFDSEQLLIKLDACFPKQTIEVVGQAPNTLNLILAGVKTDIIRYAYPLIDEVEKADGYQLLGIPDIAAMKLSAMTNRGSKKDFVDLAMLLQRYSLAELLAHYEKKFPQQDTFFVLRSLGYFDDADAEPDPVMLVPMSWEEAKAIITENLSEEL